MYFLKISPHISQAGNLAMLFHFCLNPSIPHRFVILLGISSLIFQNVPKFSTHENRLRSKSISVISNYTGVHTKLLDCI